MITNQDWWPDQLNLKVLLILISVMAAAISISSPLFGKSVGDTPSVSPERGTVQNGQNNAKGEAFAYLGLADPVGEFQNHVDWGYGAGLGGLLFLGEYRLWGLRAEATYVVYGRESRSSRSLGSLISTDVKTTYSISSAGLGPQFCLGSGLIRPYLYGTIGFSVFRTKTEEDGDFLFIDIDDDEPTFDTNDFQIAFTGGGGLSVKVRSIFLDLSVSYQHNGLTKYLAEGADRPIHSQANLIYYRVGSAAPPLERGQLSQRL